MKKLAVVTLVALAAILGGCDDHTTPWQPVPPADRFASPAVEHMTAGRAPRGLSEFVIGSADLPLGGLLVLTIVLALRKRRLARREERLSREAPVPGRDAVVFGVVELEPDDDTAAVKVVVEQVGKDIQQKSGWTHTWRETRRTVQARPFLLRQEDGGRVRVVPGSDVLLRAELSRVICRDRAARARVAELVGGERVHVLGKLVPGASEGTSVYRGAPETGELRSPAAGPMVISTEVPGKVARDQVRYFRGWAIAFALSWLFAVGVVLPEIHLLLLDGARVEATVTAIREWEVYVKPKNGAGHWVSHYALRASSPEGREPSILEDECTSELYDCVRTGGCTTVPFVVSRRYPSFYQLGTVPVAPANAGVMVLMLAEALLFVVFAAGYMGAEPWYWQRRVTDRGSGKLG